MGLFGLGNSNSAGNYSAKKKVQLKQDASGSSAISMEKVEQSGGIDLRKKSEAVGILE